MPENENVYLVKYRRANEYRQLEFYSRMYLFCARCRIENSSEQIDYDGYDDFCKVKSKIGKESTVFRIRRRIRRRIRIPNSANYRPKIFEIGLKYRIRALRISN